MEQDDLAGIEQRMDMMLSIIGEQKKRLEEQEKNIRYTCAQVAQARPNLGVPFVEEHAVQRVNFEPVSLSPAHSFIINYLTDGLRNGTMFFHGRLHRVRQISDGSTGEHRIIRKKYVSL